MTLRAAGLIGHDPYPAAGLFRWELAAAVIAVAVTVWCLVTRRIPEAGWVGVQVLALSCQVWLLSLARAVLLWFPLFILVGSTAAGTMRVIPNQIRRGVLLTGLGFEAAAMVWWARLFLMGGWAG